MFEPKDDDVEWLALRNNQVKQWYLYQSCGVHCLTTNRCIIYMFAEKDYPLRYYSEILKQMVKPGFLKFQNHFMSDHQAYKLLRKYEKIVDPSLRKSMHKK